MKRAVTGIVVLLFLSMFTHCQITSAADTYEVSADNVNAKIIEDDRYLIPVNLYGNSGIMGFRVMLSYDSRDVRILSISRGLITAKGNFAANISDIDGTADIIWNDTADVKTESGSLFFIIAEKISDDLSIEISFSQPDTFDEKYEDVCLICKKITIKSDVQIKAADTKTTHSEESAQMKNEDASSNIDAVMQDSGEADYSSRNNITSEEEAENNALKDYIKTRESEVNNISESGDQSEDGESSVSKKEEYKGILDIPHNKKIYVVIFLGVVVLAAAGISYKKYLMKDAEGKNEEKK